MLTRYVVYIVGLIPWIEPIRFPSILPNSLKVRLCYANSPMGITFFYSEYYDKLLEQIKNFERVISVT